MNKWYKNVHTGEIWKLNRVESIPNFPKPVAVYIFENGERWAADLFFAHFVETQCPPSENCVQE